MTIRINSNTLLSGVDSLQQACKGVLDKLKFVAKTCQNSSRRAVRSLSSAVQKKYSQFSRPKFTDAKVGNNRRATDPQSNPLDQLGNNSGTGSPQNIQIQTLKYDSKELKPEPPRWLKDPWSSTWSSVEPPTAFSVPSTNLYPKVKADPVRSVNIELNQQSADSSRVKEPWSLEPLPLPLGP
jgi:hypothetical protein